MHGSSYEGDCVALLRTMADVYEDRFGCAEHESLFEAFGSEVVWVPKMSSVPRGWVRGSAQDPDLASGMLDHREHEPA